VGGIAEEFRKKTGLEWPPPPETNESGEAALYKIEEGDFMTCERYHCRMRKAMCVARQLKADEAIESRKGRYSKYPSEAEMRYWMCYDCAQGVEVAKEMGILRRPEIRGQSHRALEVTKRKSPLNPPFAKGGRAEGGEKRKAHGGKYSKGEKFPEVARMVRRIRQETGLTQSRLGEICGIEQGTISRAERGLPVSKESAVIIEAMIKRIEVAHGED
jgi:DNA-binding XRE family transcriptional regulator